MTEQHRHVGKARRDQLLPRRDRRGIRHIGRDQHRAGRKLHQARDRRFRQGAGIDDNMIVGARQCIDGASQPLRGKDCRRVRPHAPEGDQMQPREAVTGDDLAERRLTPDQFGDAGSICIVGDD